MNAELHASLTRQDDPPSPVGFRSLFVLFLSAASCPSSTGSSTARLPCWIVNSNACKSSVTARSGGSQSGSLFSVATSCARHAAIRQRRRLTTFCRLIVDNFGVDAFYDTDRLQGLCHDCHSSKTALKCGWTGRIGTKLTGLGDRSNITVVCDPVGSGKSTYVAEQSEDLVWDYDAVMSEITGLPPHEGLPGASALSWRIETSRLKPRDTAATTANWLSPIRERPSSR